jgi:hypothetical protein
VDDVRKLIEHLSKKRRSRKSGKLLAPGTITSCVNILSGLPRYALKRKLVAHNVVRDLDRYDRPGTNRPNRALAHPRRDRAGGSVRPLSAARA